MANTATLKHPPAQLPAAFPAVAAPAFAMLSHPGRLRHINQDACAALPEHGAFVVCDGVGGAVAGEVASQLAADAFLASVAHPTRAHHNRRVSIESEAKTSPTSSDPANGDPRRPSIAGVENRGPQRSSIDGVENRGPQRSSIDGVENHPPTRLQRAVHAANRAVFQRAQRARAFRGMATTLVAAVLEADPSSAVPRSTLWLAHVGDSRCYLFRNGALRLLTQDHSLVEEQLRAGLITRAQVATSPVRNIITRAVGSQLSVEPEIACHPTQSGDLILLASDGLTRELDDDAIARLLIHTLAPAPAPTLQPVCQALVDAANANGGRDNITVLLVACP